MSLFNTHERKELKSSSRLLRLLANQYFDPRLTDLLEPMEELRVLILDPLLRILKLTVSPNPSSSSGVPFFVGFYVGKDVFQHLYTK